VTVRRLAALAIALGLGACAQPHPSLGDPNLDEGREVFLRVCAVCHGGEGEGKAGPALAEVLTTFPACRDHLMWITLGSARWKAEVGPTFGAANRAVTKVMPSFETVLTAEEIAQVAAFERLSFGRAAAEAVLADCELS